MIGPNRSRTGERLPEWDADHMYLPEHMKHEFAHSSEDIQINLCIRQYSELNFHFLTYLLVIFPFIWLFLKMLCVGNEYLTIALHIFANKSNSGGLCWRSRSRRGAF